ncbi:MAG: acetamidase/formamidase family protein [Gemmatimonadaceae bacterium]|jgi:acetamidase/formamidase|nr:acetamidase/formamidase family protein [Gemmatimonadaceae bacterium]
MPVFRRALLLISLAASWAGGQSTPVVSSARLTGEWVFSMEGDAQPQRVTLAMRGDSLSGEVYGRRFSAGVRGSSLVFRVGDFRWRAAIRGDSLIGWLGIDPDSSQWRASRIAVVTIPRAWRLEPTTYSRRISATETPVLRLAPGDTVHTSTVDAGGWGRGAFGDRANKKTMGGNPLTGPFYVEGAVPGDVIAVTLHRVRLNRDWAFSGTWLVDNAIEPGYAAARIAPANNAWPDNKWVLDTVRGTARLRDADSVLAGFRVPLRPFLGVVAVAPDAETAPSSRESGAYGGNMENQWVREGATILLPVRTLGAALYIGDGHAAQGDGELTGDAMETSLDVSFSVALQRNVFADIVRATDATQLMSFGVGGSLDEAMRRATSDMARWLEKDFGLRAADAAIVMGFALRFDIPDVVPPGFGVTARLPRAALEGLRRR